MNWLLIQFLIQGEIYVRNYHIFISVYNGIHLQKKYCASNSFIEFSKETYYIFIHAKSTFKTILLRNMK